MARLQNWEKELMEDIELMVKQKEEEKEFRKWLRYNFGVDLEVAERAINSCLNRGQEGVKELVGMLVDYLLMLAHKVYEIDKRGTRG
ncbi:MAG: hypothetical protein QXO71_11525 [Candidatus Jordarchaeaceae archaeon]